LVTGASGRNWAAYGADVAVPADFPAEDRALLTDPQTSGGLLVACAPSAVEAVLAVFRRHGFEQAGVVGRAVAGGPGGAGSGGGALQVSGAFTPR
jgi:selenide,water dikinase